MRPLCHAVGKSRAISPAESIRLICFLLGEGRGENSLGNVFAGEHPSIPAPAVVCFDGRKLRVIAGCPEARWPAGAYKVCKCTN